MRDCRSTLFAFPIVAILTLTAVSSSFSTSCRARGRIDRPNDLRLAERLSAVHVPFIANEGQANATVAYYAATFAGSVFVTRDGEIVYALPARGAPAPVDNATASASQKRGASSSHQHPRASEDGWSITETVVGGTARPAARERAATAVSYFVGDDARRWASSLPTFERISLGEVWPGISVDLQAHGRNVEKLFTILPGADPSRIRMAVAGATALRVGRSGALTVATGLGEVRLTPPAAFQERDGVRIRVATAYVVDGREYGFRLGVYDHTLPVTIDPVLQATYLGGTGIDQALALAIHPVSHDVYVAGYTASTNFPGTAGGPQSVKGVNNDAFVAHLDSTLTTLSQATYLGGSGDDKANALAIHPSSGDVYVAGGTGSNDFPGTAGGAQPTNNGLSNAAFVVHLNASLTTLVQSTYVAGGVTVGYALAIHPTTGDVYVGGSITLSVLPGATGGAQPMPGGAADGFVTRLNSTLTAIGQSTYLGGGGGETVHALAIHPTTGDVYAVGDTSSSTNFPGTTGGAQPIHGNDFGNSDAFVARLNAGLTAVVQSTYLGGNNQETAEAVAIHPTTGDVYVAGWTESTNFPGTSGGAEAQHTGGDAVFVARLDSGLTTLTQSTYLGINADRAFALAIHPSTGEVYVAGQTSTTNLAGTTGGAQSTLAGPQDGFVARLNAGLTTLQQATYLGGGSNDVVNALAIHPTTGDVYVAGYTFSTNFPGTAGGAQAATGGSSDAFVARLTANLAAAAQASATLTVSLFGSGSGTVVSNPAGIACPGDCTETYGSATSVALTAAADAGSVFTGWLGACSGAAACQAAVAAPTSVSATFALTSHGPFTGDLDGNGAYDALTDGLLVLRARFGLTGPPLTTAATATDATRTDPAAIIGYLQDVRPMLDIDGNGDVDALTDGLILIRYLFGLRGNALIAGAIGSGATRTTAAEVEAYVQTVLP
jgi:hypothetical protein